MLSKQVFRILVPAVACVGLLACGAALPSNPSEKSGELTGVIAAIQPGPVETKVLVSEQSAISTSSPNQFYLLVGEDAKIVLQREDGAFVMGDTADLKIGARVRAQGKGIELRSLPPQYPVVRVELPFR